MSNDEKYKLEPHHFVPLFKTGKKVCSRCGFVSAKNKLSEWVNEKGCMAHYHPQYEKARKKFTRLFDE